MGDEMSLLHVFAGNLKKYRTLRGLSQEDFAKMAGLHRTYISTVEREKRSIALDNVEKIAFALGINTYLLFVDESPNGKKFSEEVI
jgi:transcriptional regulator with XRE-family HTH domain